MILRTTTLLAAALAPLAWASLQEQGAHEPGAAPVRELFARQCSSCHLAPDPAFMVDRAWIHQLKEPA